VCPSRKENKESVYQGSSSKTKAMENFDVMTETPSVAVVRSLLNPNVQNCDVDLFDGLDSASVMQPLIRTSSRNSRHSNVSRNSHTWNETYHQSNAPQEIPRRERDFDHDHEYGYTATQAPSHHSHHQHNRQEAYALNQEQNPVSNNREPTPEYANQRLRTPDRVNSEEHVQPRRSRNGTRREERAPAESRSSEEQARRRALFERADLNQWEFENHPQDTEERHFRDSCGAANMLSGEDIIRSKHMVLMELRDIEVDGAELTQKYTLDSDFDEMHCELLRQRRYMDCRHRVTAWTNYIKLGAFILEFVNIYIKWYAYSPLNLDGFGMHLLSNTGDMFHLPLKRCYYKYVKRVSDSPIWDLGVAMAMSIALFHFKGQMPVWMNWFTGSQKAAPSGTSASQESSRARSPGATSPSVPNTSMGGLMQMGQTMLGLAGPMFSQFAQSISSNVPANVPMATSSPPAASATVPNVPPRAPFGITLPPPLV
jgi:hypothetical protein